MLQLPPFVYCPFIGCSKTPIFLVLGLSCWHPVPFPPTGDDTRDTGLILVDLILFVYEKMLVARVKMRHLKRNSHSNLSRGKCQLQVLPRAPSWHCLSLCCSVYPDALVDENVKPLGHLFCALRHSKGPNTLGRDNVNPVEAHVLKESRAQANNVSVCPV